MSASTAPRSRAQRSPAYHPLLMSVTKSPARRAASRSSGRSCRSSGSPPHTTTCAIPARPASSYSRRTDAVSSSSSRAVAGRLRNRAPRPLRRPPEAGGAAAVAARRHQVAERVRAAAGAGDDHPGREPRPCRRALGAPTVTPSLPSVMRSIPEWYPPPRARCRRRCRSPRLPAHAGERLPCDTVTHAKGG